MVKWRAAIVLALLLIGFGLLVWVMRRGDIGETRRLPDGSTFELVDVVFAATNHTMKYRGGSRFLRFVAPILPQAIQSRFSGPSADLGGYDFGGVTNMLALTVHRPAEDESLGLPREVSWLRVSDENGNSHEAIITGGMFNPTAYNISRWEAFAFPHRGKTLTLQFLAGSKSGWTNAAEFRIRNPLYARYPQWTLEALPNTKQADTLAVTLREFHTWTRMTATNLFEAARTRLVYSFADYGSTSEDWGIQKLTISDATGNRWSPNLGHHHLNWTTNGAVEFFGGLWPGEQAWKLQLEVVRTAGFEREQTWEVRVPLPPGGVLASLTNSWQRGGVTVSLVSVASPETEHGSDFQAIGKWWGSGRKSVYSLALRVSPKPADIRLRVLAITDQAQRDIKIVEHRGQDFVQQAVFFKPPAGATEARFTFALQRSRFVEFLARPEFRQSQ